MTKVDTAAGVPSVSVLLPVRNGMPYLPRAVASILEQSWSDLELLVIDDSPSTTAAGDAGSAASGDEGTAAYLSTLGDARVRVLSSGGGGLAVALNLGLSAARAPIVARQDADDWSHPDRLAQQLAWMRTHPDIDVLATAVDFVDAANQSIDNSWTRQIRRQWDVATQPDDIAALMPLTCCLFHATVMARTSALRAAGGYDPAMVPAEDYDLWLRMLPASRFARLPRALYTVRVHDDSSSARRKDDQLARVIMTKLRYVRRQAPWLAAPITLSLPQDGRGAGMFRAVAAGEGFVVEAGVPADADVIAVTALAELETWRQRMAATGHYRQFGNLFVRCREGGAQPTAADIEAESLAHDR